VRISLCASEEALNEGLTRLTRYLNQQSAAVAPVRSLEANPAPLSR
jgi:hypothetical protein